MRYQENEIDEKKITEAMEIIVDQVKNYRDPIELKQLYKLFKKNVPFSLRSYVVGLITKNAILSGRFRARTEHSRTRDSESHKQFDESVAVTLFISIGRNRHVFARDIVGILTHAAGVDRDHIGAIRILDNYSFVQVLNADASSVIEKLNGYEYRGRKLSVSYSRKNEPSDDNTDKVPEDDYVAGDNENADIISDSEDAETEV